MSGAVRPKGFVDYIKDSNTTQVLDIHLRARGQMLHKHSCCTKIIKHWVAYWFPSLYQCFRVASGRKTVGWTCPSSLCVHLQRPRGTGGCPRPIRLVVSVKMCHLCLNVLIYRSDLGRRSLRVHQEHNITGSIHCNCCKSIFTHEEKKKEAESWEIVLVY